MQATKLTAKLHNVQQDRRAVEQNIILHNLVRKL